MKDVNYARWAKLLLGLYEAEGKIGSLRILDAACGTGALAIELAKAGHNLTGADSSDDMLRIAAQKAREAGVRIPFIAQDLRAISLHKKADVINCACDGVNYLTDEQDVKAFFYAAFAQLGSGGLLCFDVSSRYKLENVLAGNVFCEDEEDAAYLWQNAYDEEEQLLEMSLTFFVKKGSNFIRMRERHVQRAHDEGELVNWLCSCGFCNIKTMGLHLGIEPAFGLVHPQTERIHFVAVKP
jgi:ubiquinone/menaquinone biosynthesis C-methylase UbiE